jgi:hypothetical protein
MRAAHNSTVMALPRLVRGIIGPKVPMPILQIDS